MENSVEYETGEVVGGETLIEIADRIRALQTQIQLLEGEAKALRDRLLHGLDTMGVEAINGPDYKCQIRERKNWDVDLERLPQEFITPAADPVKIRTAIADGVAVPGVKMKAPTRYLVFKGFGQG